MPFPQVSFQDFLNTIPIGLVIVGYERRIYQANGAFLRMIGRSKLREILHKSLGEVMCCVESMQDGAGCGNTVNCQRCIMGQAIDKAIYDDKDSVDLVVPLQVMIEQEYHVTWLKANIRSFKIKEKPYCSICLQNITNLKKIEKKLSEFQDKAENWIRHYELLAQNTQEIILFVQADGRIEEANLAACQTYGYTQTELLQLNISDLEALGEIIEDGPAFETWHKRKDGRVFPVQVSSQKTYIQGQMMRLFIIHNITDQKNYEVQLKQAVESANIAYEAKSQFLANMSHEIRTPLNGMMGMIDLTLGTELTLDQRENLEIAKTCAESLLQVLNDILDVSKLEVGKFSVESIEFDLIDLVQQTAKTHGRRAELKGLEFSCQIAAEVPKFFTADPQRLQQILNNLLNNAIKFTDQGRITLAVKVLVSELAESCIQFAVSDTGIGITPRNMEKIFVSFSQVDNTHARKYGGTGLGLSICKKLVELMNGEIWAESQLGQGSTFFFTLPWRSNERRTEDRSLNVQESYLNDLVENYLNPKQITELNRADENFAEPLAMLEQAVQEEDLASVEVAAGTVKQLAWENNLEDIRTLAFQMILAARRDQFTEVKQVFQKLTNAVKVV